MSKKGFIFSSYFWFILTICSHFDAYSFKVLATFLAIKMLRFWSTLATLSSLYIVGEMKQNIVNNQIIQDTSSYVNIKQKWSYGPFWKGWNHDSSIWMGLCPCNLVYLKCFVCFNSRLSLNRFPARMKNCQTAKISNNLYHE